MAEAERGGRSSLGRCGVAATALSRGGRGGGVLLVAAACLAAGCNDKGSTAPSSPAPAPSATTPAPVPPTLPPAPTQPVSLAVKLNPNPPSGTTPLDLHVSLCGSRPVPPVDGYPLTFTLDWGEGRVHTRSFCRNQHTYETAGEYRATFCASDGIAGHESCASFRVRAK